MNSTLKITAQRGLRGLALAIWLAAAAASAWPQAFPSKPVHILVPFPPGGPTDITARLYAEKLAARLAQPFVVENKPGPNGIAVYNAMQNAPSDGHTLAFVSIGGQVLQPAINAYLKKPVDPDVNKLLVPVGMLAETPLVVVTNPALGINTLQELITYAKANPGKLNFASDGVGSSTHLAEEMFNDALGIKATHIPYKGTVEVMNAMMQGAVQYSFSGILAAIGLHKAGKVKILATGGSTTVPALPGIPTVAEAGNLPGFDVSSWFAIYAPKDMPGERIAMLNTELQSIARMPEVAERFSTLGLNVRPMSARDLGQKIEGDLRKWSAVLAKTQPKLN